MRVFVTGASGWIGSAVTDELLAHGHQVVGLARSDEAAAALEAKGAASHRGSLDDLDGLASAADTAEGVIHLAFKHDFADYAGAGRSERAAVARMLDTLKGSDRPFLLASGLASGVTGRPLTEDDASPHHGADSLRGGSENLALEYVDRGVRPVALRFSPTVHGMGDHGFTATLAKIAKERGVAGYLGDGATRWAAVHRSDAAQMVGLALEKAPAGSRMHAVAENGLPSRDIAAAIGAYLGLPTASVPLEAGEAHFGWISRFFGLDLTASNARTRELLGWAPTGPTLFEDIAAGAYALPG
ncbi:SDR family oxidoreductase [Frankia sp. CNm7]|uniref:SDR family oxidoreductase n=1 Tax=Frankia nepalensis TaxID=1836974 RepID=A0A937RFN8_9ACTN|nr:SDR family oxidoreductase [Frankia nepalensis]MBL7498030.1 SDR family oxidoreductase [Frankia nepalensis]MBL7515398.1 SDR family oxidoreductase [Frankia nepalensis]MBL7523087.1 SDR family oxidoreductase [Frankia nepalensis]MBL7629332.1 SDR family oxidoreductase [Frankia nepalensis]